MPFDPDILDLMSSIVTYEPFASRDVYGNASFGTTLQLPAHVTYKRKITRDDRGDESVSTAQIQIPAAGYVWLNGDFPVTVPVVTVDDRFILPIDGVERKVLTATRYTDDDNLAAGYDVVGQPYAENHQSIELT